MILEAESMRKYLKGTIRDGMDDLAGLWYLYNSFNPSVHMK